MNDVAYVVFNENVLGYIDNRQPGWFFSLSGGVMGSSSPVSNIDKLRSASLADFDRYRVHPPGSLVKAAMVKEIPGFGRFA